MLLYSMIEVSHEEDKTEKAKKISFRNCTEQCKICGSIIVGLNRARHNKTKTHLDAKYLCFDMCETQ